MVDKRSTTRPVRSPGRPTRRGAGGRRRAPTAGLRPPSPPSAATSAAADTGPDAAPPRQFWLFKSEPNVFSLADLERCPQRTTHWDGVRNYQARNLLRDIMRVGDGVLFYHSNADPLAIVGTARIVRAGYPDHTAWDPQAAYYDPAAKPAPPTWYMVDIQWVQTFPQPVTRTQLLAEPRLQGMLLLQRGSRLSVQPVTAEQWQIIHELAGVPEIP